MANPKIVASAIKFYLKENSEFFIIFTGKRHGDCFLNMKLLGIEHEKSTCEQGFMTDTNQFLDRNDAGSLAFINGQTKEFHRPLTSEDLW